jgi:ribosome-interacting GTPase 1
VLTAEIHNAEILMRCDATIDELIDVIVGRAHYVKALYVPTPLYSFFVLRAVRACRC